MVRTATRFFLALILLSGTAGAAFAGRRVALVIGNSAYAYAGTLPNPKNDATAIAEALHRDGFGEVTLRTDLTGTQLLAELRAFGDLAIGTDWAVVYYAGHGVQVDGQNYLIPIDARLARSSDVEDEAVPLERVMSKTRGARKLRLVILDACRSNPFAARMVQTGRKRALGRGLAAIEPESGEMVAYAARDGHEAEDGKGRHSPFTAALLAHIEEPGLEVNLLFRKVRGAVMAATGNAQEPFVYGSLPEEAFYFKAPPVGGPWPQTPMSEAAQAWNEIKGLDDIAVFESFRKQYGTGNALYGKLAAQRIEELKRRLLALTPHPNTMVPPDAHPALPKPVCNMQVGEREIVAGRVIGFLTRQEAQAAIQQTQAEARGTISPDYANQQRVRVEVLPEGVPAIVLVPHNMTVRAGDVVQYVGAHRAEGLPCHYIPNLISRVISRASAQE